VHAPDSTRGSDEAALRQALSEYVAAVNDGNPVLLARLMTADAAVFNADGKELYIPWADIPVGLPPTADYRIGAMDVKVAGNAAFMTGYLYGETKTRPRAASIFWLRDEDGWKISHAHFSIVALTPLEYLVTLPKDYDAESGRTYPLIVFLHGSGERGDDLAVLKKNGLPKVIDGLADFPFITISPQCPRGTTWPMLTESLNALLDDVMTGYPVDAHRVYLTGLSMGGYGVWAWSMAYPERFAAIAPVSAVGDPSRVERIKNLPVWAFHGARDRSVPLTDGEKVVEALKKAGGDVTFTVYPDGPHDIWDRVYTNPELYAWFLRHGGRWWVQ
jgi:predicted esterase/ketosteroid isomerase-like protein